MGEMLQYWQFFPRAKRAGDHSGVGLWHGASVAAPDIPVGEHLYGYWPMATHAVLAPHRVSSTGFSDGAPHRAGLHAVYNHYLRTNTDPFYQPFSEDIQALLRPLFITSWLIDDFLADQQFFGASTVLLSSASSKTGLRHGI